MALPKSWAQVLTLMEEDRKLKDECFANLSDFDRDRLRAASTTTQRGVNLGLLSGFAFATFLLWRKTRIELADIRNYHSTGPIHVRYADGREQIIPNASNVIGTQSRRGLFTSTLRGLPAMVSWIILGAIAGGATGRYFANRTLDWDPESSARIAAVKRRLYVAKLRKALENAENDG